MLTGPSTSQPRTPARKVGQSSQNTPKSQPSQGSSVSQGTPSSQLSGIQEMEDDDDLLANMET